MKRAVFCMIVILLCVSFAFSMAESMLQVVDYSLPEINLDDKPEDYYGAWKCVYVCIADKAYDYESVYDYCVANGATVEYEGKNYSYADMSKDSYYIVFDNENFYEISGSVRITRPFEYIKETDSDHSGIFLLQDGRLISKDVNTGVGMIFEKQTALQLLDFAFEAKNSALSDSTELSSLNYQELVALKDQINIAIWNCKEWQEVIVPQGVWKIGEDIPEGHWTIRMADNGKDSLWCSLTYCSKLDETGKSGSMQGVYLYQQISEPGSNYFAPEEYDLELKSGMYIIIEKHDVVFSPYSGKPDLGFK